MKKIILVLLVFATLCNLWASENISIINLPESNATLTKIFRDSLLQRAVYTYPGYKETFAYTYKNNRLLFTTHSIDDVVLDVEYYLRSSSDSSLMGIKRLTATSLVGQSYLYEDEKMFQEINSGFVVEGDFELNKEGNIVYTEQGIIKVYSPEGLLLEEQSPEYSAKYFYEDGVLTETEKTEEDILTREFYNNGILNTVYRFTDGVITELSQYRKEGMVKTVYSKGIPLADVYYMPDNIRVKEIVYY